MTGEYRYLQIFVKCQYYGHEQITDPSLTNYWMYGSALNLGKTARVGKTHFPYAQRQTKLNPVLNLMRVVGSFGLR